MEKPKIFVNWSGGKDSCLSLHKLVESGEYNINHLFTTVSETYNRVSMHGVRTELLEIQAQSLGFDLVRMNIPDGPSMEQYEKSMRSCMEKFHEDGITHAMYGDIFLEDLKNYRDEKLKEFEMTGVYPIWKRDTTELVHEFIDLGYKTMLVCIDNRYLDESFVGRVIDKDFLNDLPDNVDPCGENGEFHTFVFDGPIFNEPITFKKGDKVKRTYQAPKNSDDDHVKSAPSEIGFWYLDLIPD